MPKQPWEEFEDIITKIHRETAPHAVITRNDKVQGKSGVLRQIDVSMKQKEGIYKFFIVIECKKYTRPVRIELVEAFSSKLIDVGATTGIMISNTGFTKGAKSIAKCHSITLLSYKEAEEIDWEKIVNSHSWVNVIMFHFSNEHLFITLKNGQKFECMPEKNILGRKNAKDEIKKIIAKDLIQDTRKLLKGDIKLGDYEIEIGYDGEIFFEVEDASKLIAVLLFTGNIRAFEFTINLQLGEGHLLIDESDQKPIYKQVISKSFELASILKHPNREITPEEYEKMKYDEKAYRLLHIPKSTKFMRAVFTQCDPKSIER